MSHDCYTGQGRLIDSSGGQKMTGHPGWEDLGMTLRTLSPVLIGRQEELSQLEDHLLSVNRGDGRFVLLTGEAGIGKTRLATELSRRARKLGCDVLWGSCSDAELTLPYLPLVEALGNHLDQQE